MYIMSPERHPCPTCTEPARLIKMTATGDVYEDKCGRFTIPLDNSPTCVICGDTKKVGTGDPCPHCEDREFLNSVVTF